MTDRPIIELTGLQVRYGTVTAVEDLTLNVPQGSVYALLGRNGSGKSSTVRCLLGQQRATAGTAQVLGLDALTQRRRIMSTVGVVPETPNIPPEMTAVQLERFLAKISINWYRSKFFARLRAFDIPRHTRFDRLSKGQQRQLSLAAAIATVPQLLILDDPTLGLDPVARRELFEELVGELADRGTTVFMTTHDLAGVEGIADRVGILKDGRLLVDEEIEALKYRFNLPAQTAVGDAHPGELPHEPGAVAAPGPREVPGTASERCGIMPTPLSLEEIFVALCGSNGGAR
jgi:ABC-2 type transport system ATP-binding protein